MKHREYANAVLDECESTNDLAKLLGEAGWPHGTWVSARAQTRGRGRLGRVWESDQGNLFFSMVTRVTDPGLWTWVPLAAAVASARAIALEAPGRSARIKWPNDLHLDGAKVGGILCEGVGGVSGSFIVIGIGINCSVLPRVADREVASLGGDRQLADRLRPRLVESLIETLAELEARGPESVREAYVEIAELVPGTQITWSGGEGEVVGLGERGELLVSVNGARVPLYAEEVSKVRAV